VLCIAVASPAFREGLHSQFQVPLPPPIDDKMVRAYRDGDSRCTAIPDATFRKRRAGGDTCRLSSGIQERLFPANDGVVQKLFPRGFAAFEQLGAAFSGSNALVASTVLAGNAGRFRFNMSYARAVSGADSTDPVSSDSLRSGVRRLTQLIANGGEATARIVVPVLSATGVNWQTAAGYYLSAGVVGTPSENRPLPLFVTLGADFLSSLSIRESETYKVNAEILFGVRPGVVVAPDNEVDLAPGIGRSMLPYAQFFVGLRQSGKVVYSATYTLVPAEFKQYSPRFQFSAQAKVF
jgi:hypothetical protein